MAVIERKKKKKKKIRHYIAMGLLYNICYTLEWVQISKVLFFTWSQLKHISFCRRCFINSAVIFLLKYNCVYLLSFQFSNRRVDEGRNFENKKTAPSEMVCITCRYVPIWVKLYRLETQRKPTPSVWVY